MLVICSLNNILTFIGLLVSAGMLILAIKAYNKFLSNKVNEFQLNTVIAFINEIQENKNYVILNERETGHYFTIIDLLQLDDLDNEKSKVYFNDPKWTFYENYYLNPLLPKSIAIKLREFNISHWNTISIAEIKKEPFILIGSWSYSDETKVHFIEKSKIEKSADFKAAIKELIISIEKWAKKYNIDDINLSTSSNFNAGYFLK